VFGVVTHFVDPAFAARTAERQPAITCSVHPSRPFGVGGMVICRPCDQLLAEELTDMM